MRILVGLLFVLSATAGAQGRVFPEPKLFVSLGDGIASGMGGVLNNTTFMQAMRIGVTARLRGNNGIDITAARLQTIIPPSGRVNDFEYTNPEGDALIVSWSQFTRTRARGIPNALTLGMGVIRRNTSEAGRTRDTWVARVGYDSDPFSRWTHGDATVGFNAFFMPANPNSLVYVATLGLIFRIG